MTIPPNPHPEQVEARPYPELLTLEEQRTLQTIAEEMWRDLQANNLGGYSGCNRPFWIVAELRRVIEDFGRRDTGWRWTKDQLDAASLANRPADDGERGKQGCRYCGGVGRFQIVSPVSDHAWATCFCSRPAALPPQPEGVKPSLVADCVDMGTPQPREDAIAEIMEKRGVTRAEAERRVDASGIYAVQPDGEKRP